jgi:hypothetical protein
MAHLLHFYSQEARRQPPAIPNPPPTVTSKTDEVARSTINDSSQSRSSFSSQKSPYDQEALFRSIEADSHLLDTPPKRATDPATAHASFMSPPSKPRIHRPLNRPLKGLIPKPPPTQEPERLTLQPAKRVTALPQKKTNPVFRGTVFQFMQKLKEDNAAPLKGGD